MKEGCSYMKHKKTSTQKLRVLWQGEGQQQEPHSKQTALNETLKYSTVLYLLPA